MANNAMVRILTALLKHQVKKLVGEDTLGVIGEELVAIGGDRLEEQVKTLLGEKATAKELEKAAISARNNFRGKISDDEIEQWMVMLPLDNLPTIVSAIEELPTSPDESKLENALRETVSSNWKKLSTEQVNNTVNSYLFCLRSALLPIEKQTLMIIGRSTLRTEDKVSLLLKLFEEYIVKNKTFASFDKVDTFINQPLDEVGIDRYRQRIKDLHSKIRVLNKEAVPINSLYVDLSVASGLSSKRHDNIRDLDKGFRESRSFLKKEKHTHVRDLIGEKSKIFLSGKPGAGKTTTLKYIAVLAAEGKVNKLPIFISLTDLATNPQNLTQYITKQFELCDFPHAELLIESVLKKGEAIVLFDGFDEIIEENGQRRQLRDEIVYFTKKYPDNKFIISCRNAASN